MIPWIRVFDRKEPRTGIWQLCLMRDKAYRAHEAWCRWRDAEEYGEVSFMSREGGRDKLIIQSKEEARKALDDAIIPLYSQCLESDVFISGWLEGRTQP